jgi:hypothetical protein
MKSRHFQLRLGAFERMLDMIPTVTAPGPAPTPAPLQTAQKSALPQAEAARGSAGENAAANIRAETTRAVDAPEQTAVAPRLREQETKERPDTVFDELVGPEPTFEESPLERQARVALDPPEIKAAPTMTQSPTAQLEPPDETDTLAIEATETETFEDPPPTPTEKAQASFAETRTLATSPEPATIDVAR